MNAKVVANVSAKPHMKNADRQQPTALINMMRGYGKRSVKYPIRICPTTPAELNSDRATAADKGDAILAVKTAIYNDTGKNDIACNQYVTVYIVIPVSDATK